MSTRLFIQHDVGYVIVDALTLQTVSAEPRARRLYLSFDEDKSIVPINSPVVNDIINAYAVCEVSNMIQSEIQQGYWKSLHGVHWRVVGTLHSTKLLMQDPRNLENHGLETEQLASIDKGALEYALGSSDVVNIMIDNRNAQAKLGEGHCPNTQSQ